MVGAGQATPTQAASLHPEVSTVLLHHDIRRDLRGSEQRMLRAINPHGFRDATEIRRRRIIPPSSLFNERELIRCISIDLVCRHVHEWRIRYVEASSLQQVHGAYSVGVKIFEWHLRCQIVGRLSSSMNDGIGAKVDKEHDNAFAIANIELMMYKGRKLCLKTPLIPARITAGTKELRAPVVVDTVDFPAFGTEIRTHFGTN